MVGDASEIDWYSPSGEKILPDREDFSVSRNDEATSLLIIYKATESSAGMYKCVARSEDKEAQATVELTIFRKSGSVGTDDNIFVFIAKLQWRKKQKTSVCLRTSEAAKPLETNTHKFII